MRATILLCFSLFTAAAQAMTFEEFHDGAAAVEAGEAPDEALVTRLVEIMDMLRVYTKALEAKTDEPTDRLVCVPRGTRMDLDGVVGMVRQQAESEDVDDDASVQGLLLRAFTYEFPCE